jgi:hypothetical protein
LLFRAVPLEAGEHEVILTFQSTAQRWGLAGSLIAALLLLLTMYHQRILSEA